MSRKTITLEIDDQGQEALLRSFHAFLLEMSALAQTAPEGKVLNQLEDFAVEKGRQTLCATLEQAVQQRIEAAEKKGQRCDSVPVVRSAKTAVGPRERS
jgi:hypothetical protein